MADAIAIDFRFKALGPVLDERGRRRFAAAEAMAAGHGGVSLVSQVTGIARSTINRGLIELRAELEGEAVGVTPLGRVRRTGGGRKSLTQTDRTLRIDLRTLVGAGDAG